MKSKKKFKAIMGVSLAVMLAVPVSVFGVSGVFGGTPKTQQTQTTASPLGLNPETDPVIMTTDYGLEIKLGGANSALTNPRVQAGATFSDGSKLEQSYAYFTTTGTAGTVNWVIIGYNLGSKTFPVDVPVGSTTETTTINTFDKYATIEGLEGATRQTPQTQTEGLGDSPFSGIIDDQDILSEIGTDDITYYKIDYTKTVTETETFTGFPNAVGANANGTDQQKAVAKDLDAGEVLCISENILFTERFEDGDSSRNSVYGENYDLYKAMYAIARSETYTNSVNTTRSCDYGLGVLGLNGIDANGKIMPQTLNTADYNHGGSGNSSASLVSLSNQYLFPLAGVHYQKELLGYAYKLQNFLVETYFKNTKTDANYCYYEGASAGLSDSPIYTNNWLLRSGSYTKPGCDCYVYGSGILLYGDTNYPCGVRPAFVLKV